MYVLKRRSDLKVFVSKLKRFVEANQDLWLSSTNLRVDDICTALYMVTKSVAKDLERDFGVDVYWNTLELPDRY